MSESLERGGLLRAWCGVLRIELRKQLFSRRALPLPLLCLLVLLPCLFRGRAAYMDKSYDFYAQWAHTYFPGLYYWFLLKGVVFFGCMITFLGLFRNELLDRSLHYYFLVPLRRAWLVTGKFAAGLTATALLFGACTWAALGLLHAPQIAAGGFARFWADEGMACLRYAGITVMACAGYGATFLLFGAFVRNSLVPAALFCTWEWLSFLLPEVLQRLSVCHYLKSLMPIPLQHGTLAVACDPTPFTWSGPGMTLYVALVLLLVCMRVRHMDIRYD